MGKGYWVAFLVGALGSTAYGLFQTRDELKSSHEEVEKSVATASKYVETVVRANEKLEDRVASAEKNLATIQQENSQLKKDLAELRENQAKIDAFLAHVTKQANEERKE